MSLAKVVPNGLKDRKCKKIDLRKNSPIPYVPEKDCVQEMVLSFKDQHLKMQINKGTELQVFCWALKDAQKNFMHVGSALEAIER
jgi:hypothetical protein